jgi:hypothetical protein
MDQGQAPMMEVLCIALRRHTGYHQAAVLATRDDRCAHGRRTRILTDKPRQTFQLTHTASLHTLAGNFHSHTDQTSSVHPTDTDQGTYNEQLYQCYPLDQSVQ